MSPGHTTERIYGLIKGQIMSGERAEGERLEPERLARDLAASATPVRDALHQLYGERLIEAWPREGFKVPVLSESGLRDLYHWNGDLAGLFLRGSRAPLAALQPVPDRSASDPADAARTLFAHLASWLGNAEHTAALAQASDRLHRARLAEAKVFENLAEERETLFESLASSAVTELRSQLSRYHRRREKAARQILAAMRAASPEQ